MSVNWLQQKFSRKERANGRFATEDEPLIQLRNVMKTYKSPSGDFTALRDITLSLAAGEFVAVVGKSGSGKSTLLNMLTGIDHPTAGEVIVGGMAIHQLSEGQMAIWRGENVGIVFQFFQLLPTLTVIENVMLPMDFCHKYAPRQRRDRAMDLLEQVSLADQAFKLPASISGGQQQRVAIARALANDPPLVVADEPTGNLDSKTALAIFDLFENLADQGKTILMVTHDEHLAQRITRTIYLADGEVVKDYVMPARRKQDRDQLPAEVRARVEAILDEPQRAVKRLHAELLESSKDVEQTTRLYETILEVITERAAKAEQNGRRAEARDLWGILVQATQPWEKRAPDDDSPASRGETSAAFSTRQPFEASPGVGTDQDLT